MEASLFGRPIELGLYLNKERSAPQCLMNMGDSCPNGYSSGIFEKKI
jgi:hypothetical protein